MSVIDNLNKNHLQAEKVESIMSSDSPYLPLKSSSFGIANFAQVNMSQTVRKIFLKNSLFIKLNCNILDAEINTSIY